MTGHRVYLLRCLPALLFLAVLTPANAQTEDKAGLDLIRDFADNVQTMSARFEQTLVDADDEVIETSTGTMQIQRPGRFRWIYDEPYEQILVADGLNVWNYDVDLEQVTVKPQHELLGHTPALLLGGSGDVLEDFDYVDSVSDRGTDWVRLRPKDTDSGFTQVELGFADGRLQRMIFQDNLQQSTLVAFFDLQVNQPIDEQQFVFSPPSGVDVVGTPAIAGQAER